jgi:hypothetical protein
MSRLFSGKLCIINSHNESTDSYLVSVNCNSINVHTSDIDFGNFGFIQDAVIELYTHDLTSYDSVIDLAKLGVVYLNDSLYPDMLIEQFSAYLLAGITKFATNSLHVIQYLNNVKKASDVMFYCNDIQFAKNSVSEIPVKCMNIDMFQVSHGFAKPCNKYRGLITDNNEFNKAIEDSNEFFAKLQETKQAYEAKNK